MLKNKDEIKNETTKISNIFFSVMGGLSALSVIGLLTRGVEGIDGYTSTDYYFNLIMMSIYAIIAGLILYLTNKKINIYKDEFPLSRRIFNLFVMISIMSIIITTSANILNYIFYDNFSWHSIIVILFGYIPAYIIAYTKVSKGELLNTNNEHKINAANFLIVYLLMQYYINIISIIGQMILNMEEIAKLIGSLSFALIWIAIILIAYKLINKKESFNLTLSKQNKK